jgi:1-acyl-sn-glycerol-3-phosphate acyltransferase
MTEEQLAPMREQVYKDPRPKEYFDRFHERTRSGPPDAMYELVRLVITPIGQLGYRARCISSEKVPASGPVIITPNHFSFWDHFFVAMFIRRRVQFMAKSQLFTRPLQFIYNHGGVFPVRRGHHDEEAFITAKQILGRGGCIVMYPEGGRSRTGKLAEKAKAGVGRLALETGAAIVPVAIHGSAKVRNWKRLQVPKVTVQYGDAIAYEQVDSPTRDQQQAVANEIFDDVKRLYAGLDRLGRRGMAQRIREQRRAERSGGRTATA